MLRTKSMSLFWPLINTEEVVKPVDNYLSVISTDPCIPLFYDIDSRAYKEIFIKSYYESLGYFSLFNPDCIYSLR